MKTRTRAPKRKAPPLVYVQFPLHENIYMRAVSFLYGSPDQINAALRRDLGEKFEGRELSPTQLGKFVVYDFGDGSHADFITLVRTKSRSQHVATLAHEVFHHVCEAMSCVGIPLSEASEEAYAYYFSWIMQKCLHAMERER